MKVETRIELEKKVVRKLVDYLGQHGWNAVEINDGDKEPAIKVKYDIGLNARQVIEYAFAVDAAWVYFSNGGRKHWVYFVFGNAPQEVINDYSCATVSNPDDFDTLMDQFDAEEAAYGPS